MDEQVNRQAGDENGHNGQDTVCLEEVPINAAILSLGIREG